MALRCVVGDIVVLHDFVHLLSFRHSRRHFELQPVMLWLERS
jgi:hypothetical protein